MNLFVLLTPYRQSIKNRWRSGVGMKNQSSQDLIILGFCFFIMVLIFKGTHDTLARIGELAHYLYLPPSHPIGLAFFMLFIMLIASNTALSLGSLFLGKDIELLLTCPVSINQIAIGKGIYVLVAASWMPFFFLFPFLLAFGIHYEAPWYYYPGAMALLIPFFSLATSIAVIMTTLFSCLIPATKTRELLITAAVILIVIVYLLLDLIELSSTSIGSSRELLRLVSIISMPDIVWLPSNWLAVSLSSIIRKDLPIAWNHIFLLFSVSVAFGSFAFLLLHAGLYRGISHIRSLSQTASEPIAKNIPGLDYVPGLRREDRALIRKEVRVFFRDLTQVAQLVILLLLCSFYLYNLRLFRAVETLPVGLQENWKQILFIVNVCMGSFIAIAICTRFVFPSLSLEGQAYWILRKSPLSIADVIHSKFRYWYWPVALVTTFFFTSGAFTIGASFSLLLIHAACAAIICYGIVGLAIGYGAIFSRFDWEYSTQLAASLGSLVFMISSITLVLINIIPGFILIVLQEYNVRLSLIWKVALLVVSSTGMLVLNVVLCRKMQQLGIKALKARE